MTFQKRQAGNFDVAFLSLAIFILAIVAGTIVRIASFRWNSRLYGDVNLFALTAREFITSGRLFYPMKYLYSEDVEYLSLTSPASNHNPLWPLLAGIGGKLFYSDDTFLILKILSEVTGFLLLFVVVYAGFRSGWQLEGLVAGSLMALSPALVDFSANGSQYILLATAMTLLAIALDRASCRKVACHIAIGLLCGIGYLIHTSMIWLPILVVAWWWDRANLRVTHMLTFGATYLISLAPIMWWNLRYFGRPFYSSATYGLLAQFGMIKTDINNDIITTQIAGSVDISTLLQYMYAILIRTSDYLYNFVLEVGPFGLLLLIVGLARCYQNNPRRISAFVLPSLIYAATVVLAVEPKFRHLVPILPLALIIAAFGFVDLAHRNSITRLLGIVCLLGFAAWSAFTFLSSEPTRYVGEGTAWRADKYDKMKPLAIQLADLEPGVVLGYAETGSIESVYYHKFPFVYSLPRFTMNEVQRLVRDFNVRYIWADRSTKDQLRSTFPQARLLLSSASTYYIFDVTGTELTLQPERAPGYVDRAMRDVVFDLNQSGLDTNRTVPNQVVTSTGVPIYQEDGYWKVSISNTLSNTQSGAVRVLVRPPNGKSWNDKSQKFFIINSWPKTEPFIFMRAYVPKQQTEKRLQVVIQENDQYVLRAVADLSAYEHNDYMDLVLTWHDKSAHVYMNGTRIGGSGDLIISTSWGATELGFGGDFIIATTFSRALSELEVKALYLSIEQDS